MKNVKVKIHGGFPQGNNSDYFRITIQDDTSGAMICEVDLNPDDFYRLLATRITEDRCNARVFDSYGVIGMKREWKEVRIKDSRLNGWSNARQEIFDAVIEDHKAEHEVDGWTMCRVSASCLSRGQHVGDTLGVTVQRFVEVQA